MAQQITRSNRQGARGPMHPTPPRTVTRSKTQRIGSRKAVSVCIYGFKLVVFIFISVGLYGLFSTLLKGVV